MFSASASLCLILPFLVLVPGTFSFTFFKGGQTDGEGKKKLWVHGLVWDDLSNGGPSVPRLPSKQIVSNKGTVSTLEQTY